MFINNFIYFNIGVCILLIVIEFSWNQYMKIRDKKMKKRILNYVKEIKLQMKNYDEFQNINDYIEKLKKELRNTDKLLAFEKAFEIILIENQKYIYFMNKISKVFRQLAIVYDRKKNDTEKAYFAYFIGTYLYDIKSQRERNFLIGILYKWLTSKSIYTRINSLEAIYKIGDTYHIIRTIGIVNRKEYQYSNELIADVLKKFKLNKEQLAKELFARFESYNNNIQMAIIKFLTDFSYVDENKILEKLMANTSSIDVKCEIMRYFQKNKNDKLKDYLIEELKKGELIANDLNIKAIGTLAYYEEDDVKELLYKLTNSKDNIIKETAYRSIEKMTGKGNIELLDLEVT